MVYKNKNGIAAMDEKDWTILDILAQERNTARTVERMFLPQPSLTYRLQQLERDLADSRSP